jgi:hypothetical protein
MFRGERREQTLRQRFAVRLEREPADSTQLEIGLMTPSSHSNEIKSSS